MVTSPLPDANHDKANSLLRLLWPVATIAVTEFDVPRDDLFLDEAGQLLKSLLSDSAGQLFMSLLSDSAAQLIKSLLGDSAGQLIMSLLGDSAGQLFMSLLSDSAGQLIMSLLGDSAGQLFMSLLSDSVGQLIMSQVRQARLSKTFPKSFAQHSKNTSFRYESRTTNCRLPSKYAPQQRPLCSGFNLAAT
ncbi:hypothetical protein CEXT_301251 [Caerostris extrusa]|uniref:DUF937 domain-containing protein n=1 Tax=Caerostris extrusa TaxID=172846 RepID=A0AAV4MAT6_CAEEX|nr:hypothetical protein CEXT_301251 [Caerostris extrusa]